MTSHRLGPLAERNFRLLFAGQATSSFGGQLAPIALAFAVLDLTGSATDLGPPSFAGRSGLATQTDAREARAS